MSSIKSIIGKSYNYLSNALSTYKDNHLRKSRIKVGQKALEIKQGKHLPITNAKREEILSFWKPYRDVSKEMGTSFSMTSRCPRPYSARVMDC